MRGGVGCEGGLKGERRKGLGVEGGGWGVMGSYGVIGG